MIMRKTLAAPALLILLAPAAVPAAEPAGLDRVTSVEGITEYRLDNGLKVLLFPDQSKPTVTVNLTVLVGSRHEGYGEAGMAHLLEHMVFKGTPEHPDIPRALSSRGARFNGSTWVDRTNYFETLPATGENLEFAIRLEADRFVNSLIKAEDLASEMTVVRNEFERGENNPEYILSQRMTAAAYEWHNYGKATIGNRADIERVPVESLRRFYRKFYQPDNAMLIVAGRFQPQEALKHIVDSFGRIPRPQRKLPDTYTQEPPQDGERMVTLRRVGDVALAGAVYHVCAGPHPDFPAVSVLEDILTDDPSGRLYKALVQTQKAASVSGSAYPWHDPGLIELMAEVNKGNEPQLVLEAMLDAIDELAENGVTKEEVERARRRILKRRELAQADTSRIAVNLSEWAAQGDWRLYFLYRDRIEQVTPEDVGRVARKYLLRSNRTVGLFLPTREPRRATIPPTPQLAGMIGDYKGRETVSAGEAFDVSPPAIEKRTRRLTLPGGANAALLEKKSRAGAVTLELTLRYGDEKNLRGLATAAEFLPDLMTRGTKSLNRQEIQDLLDKYQAQLRASGNAGTATFNITTKREHLSDVLRLLGRILREASLPEKELELLKQGELARLQQQLTSPQALALNAVRRAIDPHPADDPRYVPTIEEEIERVRALSIEDVRRLYDEYLNSEHAVLAVVGDFDAGEVRTILAQALSGWESSKSYQRLARESRPVKGGQVEILTPDKANSVYFAAMTLPIRDDHPDYPALVLGNYVLGGGSLSSRLADRVRQKEGLSYGVGSNFQASALDRRSAFYIYAICNPDNMPQLKTAVREELDRILRDGVTEEELADAKQGYLQSQQVARTRDGRLAGILTSTIEADRTMQYYAELETKINSVTAAEVHQALKKHVDADDLVVVAAGDFERSKREPQ